MNYGFFRVCAANVKIKVADVQFNSKAVISAINQADEQGAQVIVFPELCLSGYTCGDLFNQRILIDGVEKAIAEIAKSTLNISALCFVGAPIVNDGRLYNCAVVINKGKIIGVVPKTNLPNYGEFYERRHFYPAQGGVTEVSICGNVVPFGTDLIFKANNYGDFTVACEICEDLWVPDSPSVRHARAGANIIVNLSCSDEVVGKAEYRKSLVAIQSAKLLCGYVYCDSGDGESTTDMVFAGHNIICENGTILAENKLFENGLLFSEIDVEKLAAERMRTADNFFSAENQSGHKIIEFETKEFTYNLTRKFSKHPFVPESSEALSERARLILTMQAKGLEKRIAHTNAKTAVIGVSGGLDSALALLVTRRAFLSLKKPLTDIIAVSMPGFGTTSRTFENSLQLIKLLGATGRTIPIKESVKVHFSDIGHSEDVHDVIYENAQARMRTMILMDVANQTGGFVVGTGDLSELALGWATYNGDHMSMYGVNSSIPKTLVRHLVNYESSHTDNEQLAKVLRDVLDTPVSPELLPPSDGEISQKTEDIVGPYELHDFFLYYFVRCGFPPEKILRIAEQSFAGSYDRETIKKWLEVFIRRFFSQQFKRSCLPDGPKVGSVTLSPRGDWRMPSDACVRLWLDSLK